MASAEQDFDGTLEIALRVKLGRTSSICHRRSHHFLQEWTTPIEDSHDESHQKQSFPKPIRLLNEYQLLLQQQRSKSMSSICYRFAIILTWTIIAPWPSSERKLTLAGETTGDSKRSSGTPWGDELSQGSIRRATVSFFLSDLLFAVGSLQVRLEFTWLLSLCVFLR